MTSVTRRFNREILDAVVLMMSEETKPDSQTEVKEASSFVCLHRPMRKTWSKTDQIGVCRCVGH